MANTWLSVAELLSLLQSCFSCMGDKGLGTNDLPVPTTLLSMLEFRQAPGFRDN